MPPGQWYLVIGDEPIAISWTLGRELRKYQPDWVEYVPFT